MFSLKSALTWGVGLALGMSLVAGLHPGVRAHVSQAIAKAEAMAEGTLGLVEETSSSVNTGNSAQIETGAQVQTGASVSANTGNASATIGTEAGASAGATSQSDWSLKHIFYTLTHSSFGLNAQTDAAAGAGAQANP